MSVITSRNQYLSLRLMRAIAPPMRTPIPLAQHRCPRRKGVAPDDVLKKRFSLEVLLKSPYYWIMHEELIDLRSGRIPDYTIVILYEPSFFERDLTGGSSVYLPKLMISSNILKRVGSEEKLHEISTRFLLSALNADTLHTSPQYAIEQHKDTNRIMVVTT